MEFVEFWTTMPWFVIVLVILAWGFAIGEALIPGFGVCGILSGLCAVGSLIAEGVVTRSLFNLLMLFVLLAILLVISFIIFVYSSKKGVLRKTPIVDQNTALPQNYGKNEELLKIGSVGKLVSSCKPVGKADFEGELFTVVSKTKNINKDKLVVVKEIKDNQIFVIELTGGENE